MLGKVPQSLQWKMGGYLFFGGAVELFSFCLLKVFPFAFEVGFIIDFNAAMHRGVLQGFCTITSIGKVTFLHR